MTRCFVGLELDGPSRAHLESVAEPLHRALRARGRWPVRWVRPENWHLTLLFFPDLREAERDTVWDTVARGAAAGAWRDPAFEWKGLSLWPTPRRPSLVALEAEAHAAARHWPMTPLLDRTPFSKAETQHYTPFRPHITLMRFDAGWRRTISTVWNELLEDAPPFDPSRICFDRVSFLLSTLSKDQPVYLRERTVGV